MSETQDNVVPINPDAQPEQAPRKATINDKEVTVRNFALIHSLLADGLFPGKYSTKLMQARGFVEQIHAQALKDFESDPDYAKHMEAINGANQAQDQVPAS